MTGKEADAMAVVLMAEVTVVYFTKEVLVNYIFVFENDVSCPLKF